MTLTPFREVTRHPPPSPAIRLLVVMLPDQASAAGSRCCLLPSHYPLRFKSIVNYLQTAPPLLIQPKEWTPTGHAELCLARREFSFMQCENCPPTSAHLLAHQCPSLRPASHFAPRRHLVSSRNFHFSCRRKDTRRDTNVHVQFLTFCPSLAMKHMLNKRLPSRRG